MKKLLAVSVASLMLAANAAWGDGDDCGKSTRVDVPECATSTHTKYWAKVVNNCWHGFKVKVDIKIIGDETAFVSGYEDEADKSDRTQEFSLLSGPGQTIRSVKCCSASSGSHCDQTNESTYSDRQADFLGKCDWAWHNKAQAAWHCKPASISVTDDLEKCRINQPIRCWDGKADVINFNKEWTIDQIYAARSCNGVLTSGSC